MISAIQVLGGLAFFLFGVRLLSGGMEKLAGDQIQQWLDRVTARPLRAALFGAGATALVQSSSLLMVTMIGLLNANLMTLPQAIGVMMGQEIGTTLTAQIAAFHLGDYALIFVVIGFAMQEFAPHGRWRDYGEVVLGFGTLFVGMNLMSSALRVLTEIPAVGTWLALMGQHQFAGIIAGIVATAVVQSSSAVTGLVVALGMSHAVTLSGAVALLLGANIGTCVTGFIASFRLSAGARQASVAQILINVTGVLLFIPFLQPFARLVALTSDSLPRQIANAHTVFNIVVSVALFPFIGLLGRVTQRLVPERVSSKKRTVTAYIDSRQYSIPSVALTEAFRELLRMGQTAAEMLELSRQALLENDVTVITGALERETALLDPVSEQLEDFLSKLLRTELSEQQQQRALQIKGLVTDIERVGDQSENLVEEAQRKDAEQIPFSSDAVAELEQLFRHAEKTYGMALQALETGNHILAERACRLEDEFDHMYMEARNAHIRRVEDGVCAPEADFTFIEVLRNLERICDHSENLAQSVLEN